jgi:hypothetical protein
LIKLNFNSTIGLRFKIEKKWNANGWKRYGKFACVEKKTLKSTNPKR